MTFQEFLEKYNGQYVETAGTPDALNQCTDLVNAHIRDVLGLPIIEWTNAVDFPSKAGDKYEFIVNTPSNIPERGDIVVWGGGNGHIAIFVEGNADTFRSFDENYPIGSPAHIQNHNYTNPQVLGWLRVKKEIVTSPDLVICQTQLADEIKKKNENYQALQEVSNELEGTKSQIHSYEDYIKQLATTLKVEPEQTKILGECVKLVKVEDQLRNEQKKTEDLTSQLADVTKTANESSLKIEGLLEASDELTKARQTCESALEIASINNNVTYKELFTVLGLSICSKEVKK